MDTTTPGQDPTQTGQDPTVNAGQEPAQQQSSGQASETFDRTYVEQLRREAAQYRTELGAIRKAQEEADRKAREEQGQYQQLYTEAHSQLQTLSAEVEELRAFKAQAEERVESERKALLSKLPEDVRPAFETATVEQINVVLARLTAPGASPAGGRQPAPARPGEPGARPPAAVQPGQPGWLKQFTENQ